MAKQLFFKHLVRHNYVEDRHDFCKIELLSVGYNQSQVIITKGKVGNQGTSRMKKFEDLKKAWALIEKTEFDLEAEEYMNLKKIEKNYEELRKKEKYKYKKKKTIFKKPPNGYLCDLCGEKMNPAAYEKINDWARGEGGWDRDEKFIGYQKVICINCQIKHDIYKKRLSKK